MTIAEAERQAKAARDEYDVALAALRLAQDEVKRAGGVAESARQSVGQAERAVSIARGRAWLDKHPDAADVVRTGTDWVRLAQLRLGRKHVDRSSWRTTQHFEWNQLGKDVRAALTNP